MTTLRLFLAALSASFFLTGCGAFQNVDSRYPTVSQQDATDVSWGLAPRKSRGNPKLRYQYDSRSSEYSAPASGGAAAAPASAPAAAPTPIPPQETVAPAVIPSNLR